MNAATNSDSSINLILQGHLLDIILLLPLAWGLIRGFMRGAVFELALLAALALGAWGGFMFAGWAETWLSAKFNLSGAWLHPLSFILVFLAIMLMVVLLGKALTGIVSLTGLGIPNRLAGGIFGMMKWALIVSLVLGMLKPMEESMKLISADRKENSYLYQPLALAGQLLLPVIKDNIKPGLNEPIN